MDDTKKSPAFATLLQAAEDGRLIDELNERTRELVQVMRQEQAARGGKPKGAITLSFAFSLDQHGLMEVTANVATKEPKAERSRSIFYTIGASMSSTTRQPYTPSLVPTPTDLLTKVDTTTATAALITHVERLGSAQTLQIVDRDEHVQTVAILPEGKSLESLKPFIDEYASAPDRIKGTATLHDEQSFVRHVLEQKRDTTRLFCVATGTKPSMTAVYNYHAVKEGKEQPAFGDHRAVWPFQLSREWQAWSAASGKLMSAAEFSEFIDARVPDVYWGDEHDDFIKTMISTLELRLASAGSLVALARNIAINVDVAVRQAQTLSTGEIAMTYVEQHKDGEGQPLRVANAFLIRIPVVLGGPVLTLLARLRYRLHNNKVSWAFDLMRLDVALDQAIRDICARVELETGLPVFQGTPEA